MFNVICCFSCLVFSLYLCILYVSAYLTCCLFEIITHFNKKNAVKRVGNYICVKALMVEQYVLESDCITVGGTGNTTLIRDKITLNLCWYTVSLFLTGVCSAAVI